MTAAIVVSIITAGEYAAELAHSPRDSEGVDGDSLAEVTPSGDGSDEAAGEYLNG